MVNLKFLNHFSKGADLVYSEELIDKKLLKTERIYNKETDSIEYIEPDSGNVIYSTCSKETGKNVILH
jgi:tRNA-dihydrouridine synthase 2